MSSNSIDLVVLPSLDFRHIEDKTEKFACHFPTSKKTVASTGVPVGTAQSVPLCGATRPVTG